MAKQLFPEEGIIQIHQLRVCPCPQLPIGFIGMVVIPHRTGSIPKWFEKLTQRGVPGGQCSSDGEVDSGREVQDDKDDGSALIGDEQVQTGRDPEVQDDNDDDLTLIGDERWTIITWNI